MKFIVAAAIAAGLATGASAQMASSTSQTTSQTTAPATADDQTSHNPALKDSHVKKTTRMADGANSFTEGQARKRIAKAGYTQVGKLTKDKDGVWMGQAMQNGKPAMVGLDYKGNVTPR